MPYSQFNSDPLTPEENQWVRAQIWRQIERKRQQQAWLAIPPLILTLTSIVGAIWGYISGLFH